MIEQYAQFCYLLEELGQFIPRLDKIQEIVQHPDFRYEKKDFPEILENTFLRSCYWLDKELFDDSYLYQNTSKLFGEKRAHLQMLDIGAILIDKGFSLEFHPEQFQEQGPHQLATYVKIFSEQCHKRHTFLKRSLGSHKKNNFHIQKIKE